MNETNSVPYLDQVLKANEALLGLPALPLVLLLSIALGYVLKFIPVYPNNWIPIGVIVGAILSNVGIAFNDGSGNYARAVIYGIIVGVASIAIHRKWLKDWLDPKMFGAFLLFGLLSLGLVGCVTPERLEAGGAYAASATHAAQPELFVLDASFDVAYSGLDTTFKYERDNRELLWKASPKIKRGLDKLRIEAGRVRDDYALARTVYLENPTPAGLDEVRTALGKMQSLNTAALAVIQKKGEP